MQQVIPGSLSFLALKRSIRLHSRERYPGGGGGGRGREEEGEEGGGENSENSDKECDLVVGEDNMRVSDNENEPTFVKNCKICEVIPTIRKKKKKKK